MIQNEGKGKNRIHRVVLRQWYYSRIRPAVLLTLALLTTGTSEAQTNYALDPYSAEYEKSPPPINYYTFELKQRAAGERQERFRLRVAIPDADVEDLQKEDSMLQGATRREEQASPKSQGVVLMALVLPLAGVFSFGVVGYLLKRRFDSLAPARALTEQRSTALLAKEPSLAGFFAELRDGLSEPATGTANSPNADQTIKPEAAAGADPVQEFFASAPGQLESLRNLMAEVIARADDGEAHQKSLLDLLSQTSGLRESTRPPELRPAWLLVSALQGLLKQLANNPSEVTASALRTASGAVDLLEPLCVPGLNPNLASEPPIHLLAVDDDPVSRLAISFALKKAFNPPDLAPDGETALGLTERQTYDVIFLDVDMPGMDGYELCTRIHQTERHRATPVVFVTRHGDFESRAQSKLSGGEDLIAKPFLAFEITVKALTLALRGRLLSKPNESAATEQTPLPALAAIASELAALTSRTTTSAAESATGEAAAASTPGNGLPAAAAASGSAPNGSCSWEQCNRGFLALFKGSADGSAQAFMNESPAYLAELRQQLQSAQRAGQPTEVQNFLSQLYLGVNSFNTEAERAELRTIARLGSALEGMLKKLLENADLCTPSALNAAAAALELLEEICSHTGPNPDLVNPPVSILVVDDDPVARRGISAAIQIAFGRPDAAESGEAALALAEEKRYDLVFLDVLMPGMDGFSACSRIHKTPLNRRTPVVFVTGQDDLEARSKAVVSGGRGFIPKPVLSSQIRLTALTFILRARLEQSAPVVESTKEACLETA